MPKCPKCNSEIDHLRHYAKLERIWRFSVAIYPDGTFTPDYLEVGETDPEDGDFECPECQEVLFSDPDQAADFMRGVFVPSE